MDTHTKLTRPQSEEIFRQYFLTECYQGPQKMWHHKCGTPIRMHPVSISLHSGTVESCPGPGVVPAGGSMEPQKVPYCNRCEKVPQETGCLHEPADATILVEVDSTKAPPILVWKFQEAPENFQKLSPHGGDEEWLALVPPTYEKTGALGWILENTSLAICNLSMHRIKGGFLVAIGKHS